MNTPILATKNKITLEDLQAIDLPISQAKGLPNPAYTDQSYFEFERNNILAKNWTAIGFVDQLEEKMIRPLNFMGLPIFISKTADGEIKVFHNVCSHRGTRLVTKERQTNGLIVCPYHSWTYSVDGELKATPHIGGVGVHQIDGFSCKDRGLKEIRCHIWLGILFVNLDGNAADFEVDAGVAINRARNLMGESGEQLMRVPDNHGSMSITLNSNWKLAIENYLEAYHLPFIHPGLNSYSPLEVHTPEVHGDKISGQVTATFDPQLDSEHPLPMFPNWDQARLRTGDYPAIYPNLLMGFQANHIFAMIIVPLTSTTSIEELKLFYVGNGASDERFESARKSNLEAWVTVFNEDIGPCENMQIGRQSPGYQGGGFSPVLDTCSHHFHKWIGRQYQAAMAETA